ncbi:bifunctional phosphopantothenoylcysteine decarboxylase/phosphopantothenate--cysteine ligase CoaBC [Sulfurovum sp. bin170]|uniref:bifunctional phosphopantothenoylcysteine decarboxylase/phosphopantothenate--cysteine ligase CoaBC n=1 Tax=Sulfurovum sp. bin170 TaxID=2695268 RepID=UPI0013DF1076|nr:bifunctional phosphopantothenoylcysteine decarboxylase/phosphopantothenate--cysteine ligase CoaBC [Sulfurovum sp. bin170]NEW59724.1 bifunctional phosphopantothenoylcysteine decarboxylase/phosphopantothenate--cysteine ligase CoaBC [Sulfurovum sp. bin170]
MQLDLKGKRVLLGVTGSISAYKACEVARLFIKAGAEVRVVMTPSAERFVSALTFEALTRNPVLTESSESWSSRVNHIEFGKDSDVFVIAPATANSINKLSKGIADNILLQTALAFNKPLLIAPSANTQMMANHYTEGSLKMLAVNDVKIISSQSKLLACGDEGDGALAEPSEIFYQTAQKLLEVEFWRDRKVVVTGGGTREKIDDVRYLSNFSSGKMANALATALYLRGADVCLITTKEYSEIPNEIYTIEVDDAQEMLEYTIDAVRVSKKGKMSHASMNSSEPVHLIQKKPYLFMAAAVSDFTPKFPQVGKIKKSDIGDKWSVELKQNPDILQEINKDGLITIGFKAEMDSKNGFFNAESILKKKDIDGVCYNLLKDSQSFGTDENNIIFITGEESIDLGTSDKLGLSFKILKESQKLENEQ